MHMQHRQRTWTLAELDRLPDDGNRYELVAGKLLVTPPPAPEHEAVCVVLARLLMRYVHDRQIGSVWMPRSVVRRDEQQTEPDLAVRPNVPRPLPPWEEFPLPLLVVETLSPGSLKHDKLHKRRYYAGLEIPEYWIVDPTARAVLVVRPGDADRLVTGSLVWHPAGAADALEIDVISLFDEALGPA